MTTYNGLFPLIKNIKAFDLFVKKHYEGNEEHKVDQNKLTGDLQPEAVKELLELVFKLYNEKNKDAEPLYAIFGNDFFENIIKHNISIENLKLATQAFLDKSSLTCLKDAVTAISILRKNNIIDIEYEKYIFINSWLASQLTEVRINLTPALFIKNDAKLNQVRSELFNYFDKYKIQDHDLTWIRHFLETAPEYDIQLTPERLLMLFQNHTLVSYFSLTYCFAPFSQISKDNQVTLIKNLFLAFENNNAIFLDSAVEFLKFLMKLDALSDDKKVNRTTHAKMCISYIIDNKENIIPLGKIAFDLSEIFDRGIGGTRLLTKDLLDQIIVLSTQYPKISNVQARQNEEKLEKLSCAENYVKAMRDFLVIDGCNNNICYSTKENIEFIATIAENYEPAVEVIRNIKNLYFLQTVSDIGIPTKFLCFLEYQKKLRNCFISMMKSNRLNDFMQCLSFFEFDLQWATKNNVDNYLTSRVETVSNLALCLESDPNFYLKLQKWISENKNSDLMKYVEQNKPSLGRRFTLWISSSSRSDSSNNAGMKIDLKPG